MQGRSISILLEYSYHIWRSTLIVSACFITICFIVQPTDHCTSSVYQQFYDKPCKKKPRQSSFSKDLKKAAFQLHF
jgi:hypothetical protein